jgi:hypothetical protein
MAADFLLALRRWESFSGFAKLDGITTSKCEYRPCRDDGFDAVFFSDVAAWATRYGRSCSATVVRRFGGGDDVWGVGGACAIGRFF